MPERAHDDERSVLVKVVITEDEDVRNRIVRATNLQTAIQPASFRASDQLQRDIEDYFLSQGWFYDRRKNHYRNLGKPANLIVGITYLAQAIAAIVLQEPDAARGAVSGLVSDERTYKRVFHDGHSPELFLFAAKTMRFVDRAVASFAEWPLEMRKKLRYHAAMLLIAHQMPRPQEAPLKVGSLLLREFTHDDVRRAFVEVAEALESHTAATGQSLDPASKARAFTRHLLEHGGYSRARTPSPETQAAPVPAHHSPSAGATTGRKPYSRRTSTLGEFLDRISSLGVSAPIAEFVERAKARWGMHTRVHYYCVNLNAPQMKSVGLVILSPASERPGLIRVEIAAKSSNGSTQA